MIVKKNIQRDITSDKIKSALTMEKKFIMLRIVMALY